MTSKLITRQELYERAWKTPMTKLATELGVGAIGLAKICDRLLIPYPTRGHWARIRAGQTILPPPLPTAPPDVQDPINLSQDQKISRRTRTRRSPAERREELKTVARAMALESGIHNTSMRAIAAQIGMSEAQAHNYFSRDELFLEIVRDELASVERARRTSTAEEDGVVEQGSKTFKAYLREVDQRGALIQDLLNIPYIREALKLERAENTRQRIEGAATSYGHEFNLPEDVAMNVNANITALCLRAGRLLATRSYDFDTLESITLDLMAAGRKRVIEQWGTGTNTQA